MSTPNDGGPAFPQHGWTSNPEVLERMKNQGGMTLRDWFAGQALPSVLRDEKKVSAVASSVNVQFTQAAALIAYAIADDMLKARSK